jgi:hypothetical protein
MVILQIAAQLHPRRRAALPAQLALKIFEQPAPLPSRNTLEGFPEQP